MSSNGKKRKTNMATALGALNKSGGLIKGLWACEGASECLCEFSSGRLTNKATEAPKGPISICSVGYLMSLCLVEGDEEEEAKDLRL